jgi:hypothetical protein
MAVITTNKAHLAHPPGAKRIPLRRFAAFFGLCLEGLKTVAEHHPAALSATLWSAQHDRKPSEAEIEKGGRR